MYTWEKRSSLEFGTCGDEETKKKELSEKRRDSSQRERANEKDKKEMRLKEAATLSGVLRMKSELQVLPSVDLVKPTGKSVEWMVGE